MKSIKDHLDDHFGVGGWYKVLFGDVELGDMCNVVPDALIRPTANVGYSVAGRCDYYRAKPKPEPKQSEKFWMVEGCADIYHAKSDAIHVAKKFVKEFDSDHFVLEVVGIVRAPKSAEYEEL